MGCEARSFRRVRSIPFRYFEKCNTKGKRVLNVECFSFYLQLLLEAFPAVLIISRDTFEVRAQTHVGLSVTPPLKLPESKVKLSLCLTN
jgi:hypothetical protein